MIKTLQKNEIPQERDAIFVSPELSQWYSILNENKAISAGIINRQHYCNELINIAKDYTCNILGLANHYTNHRDVILTGHQPVWHHCGIWAKDIMTYKLAQSVDGIGVHLILDHDVCDTSMTLPVKNYNESWSFENIEIEQDGTNKDIPLEFRAVPNKENIIAFLNKVINETNNQICRELWLDYSLYKNIASLRNIADLITYLQAVISHSLGLNILYLPVSEMCSTNAFHSFVLSIICDANEFAHYYNRGINLLCNNNGNNIRNNIKFLEIEEESDMVELPFWLVSQNGQRSSLWVTKKSRYIEIGTKNKTLGNIESSSWDNEITQLYKLLEDSNYRIRPKAITLTLFSRLFLADIFIHGIGAKSYEPVTDYILENYCRMRLLKYGIATSTMTLSSKNQIDVLRNDISFLKSQKRELKFKPENFINESILNSEPVASLVLMKKQKIILCQDDYISDEERKSAWHSISQINMVLSSYAQGTLEELELLIMNTEKEIASNKVFSYREFFFGLFPDNELQKLSNSFSYARAVI